MRLVVSNIAWTPAEEPAVAAELQKLGVKYVEIAPTKVWEDPLKASDEDIKKYKDFWAGFGIQIVAFQSMLFTRPDLKIFESAELRAETLACLKEFIALAGRMDVGVMVFGSPKNRVRGDMPLAEATAIAKDFFAELGAEAAKHNVTFCIEPNAPQYNCDFVTTAQEGIDFVKTVNTPGFGLHLDAACMTMAGDKPEAIQAAKGLVKHFHISAPFLGNLEETEVKHQAMADNLKQIDYQGFVSIEMRPSDEGKNVERVRQAVTIANKYYA